MRKKAMTGIEQVMVIILILLTLGAVFMVIYKGDILTKLRNLPGYGQSQSSGDEVISTNDQTTSTSSCPVAVGNVKGDYDTSQAIIYFCQDIIKQQNCRGSLYSGLKISGNEVQREVNWWPIDQNVGSFVGKTISLDSQILSIDSDVYAKLEQVYNFQDLSLLLKNLNGARLVGNDICRDSLITS